MYCTFSELKEISGSTMNFANHYLSMAKGYIDAKIPYSSIRHMGKAKTLSRAYGTSEIGKNIISLATKNKNAKIAINMMLSMKYDQLRNKIKKEGKSKGLRGVELRSYIRKTLKSKNLRRFGR